MANTAICAIKLLAKPPLVLVCVVMMTSIVMALMKASGIRGALIYVKSISSPKYRCPICLACSAVSMVWGQIPYSLEQGNFSIKEGISPEQNGGNLSVFKACSRTETPSEFIRSLLSGSGLEWRSVLKPMESRYFFKNRQRSL
jgi:hypothetical protein